MLGSNFNGVAYRLADEWFSHVNLNEYTRKPINYLEIGAFYGAKDRKSTRLNSSHTDISRMPSSA